MANSVKFRAGMVWTSTPARSKTISNLKTSGNMLNAQRLPTQASTPRSTLRPHLSGPVDVIHLHPPTCNARSQLSGPAVPDEAEPRVKPTRALCCNGPTHHDPLTRVEADHPVARTTRVSKPHEDNRGGEADGHLDDGLACGAIF
ncbi:hypothetical protein D9611_014064 [Ephemerocybe angulata]|uniref:Uncharacterized protein n=1 Tax=Ephemerocybe angulata TaxID=980116 RepID=A0A8H5ARR6_9AGAR|nr:hypothetical protein D9611_014068 [Tulosesus angulatus]KAF5309676.1 hypothetical protein D9611_014064 [Tulosesus angulatus]